MNGNFAFSIKGTAHIVLVAAALCWVTACGNQEPPRAAEVQQIRQEAERKIQEAERQRVEADKARIEAEKARKDAEKARKDAEDSKSVWQNAAWGLGIAAIIALLLGIVFGSSARKDSNARKPPVE